jgi:hypothetical protein
MNPSGMIRAEELPAEGLPCEELPYGPDMNPSCRSNLPPS